MNEDKIIEIVKDFISYIRFDEKPKYGVRQQYMAIENLLDLYQKEKEKNKELSEELTEQICNKVEVEVLEEYRLKLKNSISKDKIREKINNHYPDEAVQNIIELLEEN